MSIPVYPKFKPLEFEDRDELDRLLAQFPPVISELTFTNLFAWRHSYKFTVSRLEGCVLVCSEADGRKRFFYPLGSCATRSLVRKVLSETNGIFFRAPENIGSLFKDEVDFKILPDRDNSDYLYKQSDLLNLAGKKYDGKRNFIRKFKSTTEYKYLKLDASSIRQCLPFEEEWCRLKDCESLESLKNERKAVREMVEQFSLLKLAAGAIEVKGKICALAIGQALNLETFVVHVLKADSRQAGLYQVILNDFLAVEAKDFKFVNLEQDLGIDGLRKFKLSYHPVHLIDKYTIMLKG